MITFLSTDRADDIERDIMRREVEGLDWLARRWGRVEQQKPVRRNPEPASVEQPALKAA